MPGTKPEGKREGGDRKAGPGAEEGEVGRGGDPEHVGESSQTKTETRVSVSL